MKKWVKFALIGLGAVLLLMQFVRIDRSVPEVDPAADFLTMTNAPAEMASLIRAACYDCHSYETQYPWYANIAPASLLMANHIAEGREHLNFSDWASYPAGKQAHKLEECAEEVAEGHMPEQSYTWMHAEARLDEVQQQAMAQWFNGMKTATPGGSGNSYDDH
jgi:hypothetical protein